MRSAKPRVVVAALMVLAAAGCGGGDGASSGACPRGDPVPVAPGAYRGTLVDAAVRLTGAGLPARLACAMDREGVERAVLSAPMDPDEPFPTEAAYREAVAGHEARFVPFFHVGGRRPADLDARGLERVVNEVGLFFRGVGEVDLEAAPWRDRSLADAPWPAVFELAARRDLFVALRLGPGRAAELEAALRAHPGAKVLVRGSALRAHLPDLLRRHEDVFALVDPATLDEPRAAAADGWLPVVQAAPDRVVWGSALGGDAGDAGDPGGYGRRVAAARALLGELPQPFRRPLAADNARRLFGTPVPAEPDA